MKLAVKNLSACLHCRDSSRRLSRPQDWIPTGIQSWIARVQEVRRLRMLAQVLQEERMASTWTVISGKYHRPACRDTSANHASVSAVLFASWAFGRVSNVDWQFRGFDRRHPCLRSR